DGHADDGLGDDEDVRRGRDRVELAVADRRHRLDAEEEILGERAGLDAADAAELVEEHGEEQVEDEVHRGRAEEHRSPGRAQDEVIEVAERRRARADDGNVSGRPQAEDPHGSTEWFSSMAAFYRTVSAAL